MQKKILLYRNKVAAILPTRKSKLCYGVDTISFHSLGLDASLSKFVLEQKPLFLKYTIVLSSQNIPIFTRIGTYR